MGRIVIVSGPPGAGKSTIARRLSKRVSAPRAMHVHTDDMYMYITKGFVPPWLPESHPQNITLVSAMAASAAICARDGYEVFVDGIVGPWFLDPWLGVARTNGLDLRFVVLMPSEAETVARATARPHAGAMTDPAVCRQMWRAFTDYPSPDHTLDTTDLSVEATVAAIVAGLDAGRFALS